MRTIGVIVSSWAGVILAAGAPGWGQAAAPTELLPTGQVILETASYWRVHAACRDAVVPVELLKEKHPEANEPVLLAGQSGRGGFGRIETAGPPDGWTAADFDDSAWFRSPGPVGGRSRAWQGYNGVRGLLSIRGKFTVNDPAAVKGLTLTLGYRGGAVVYLNGTELARRDLPAGPLTAATPGAIYPPDAYVDAAGKLLTNRDKAGWAAAETKRNRSLGPVSLPAGLLRKGVNVLAIQIYRSDFRPEADSQAWNAAGGGGASWAHIEFNSLRLAALAALTPDAGPGAAGVVPNTSRPRTQQVWNQDPHRVFGVDEYGDPNETLRPVRMVGARNGSYCGQVVIGSPSPLEGLKVTVSDLVADGGGKIAARQVAVSYARLAGPKTLTPSVVSSLSEYAEIRTPSFLGLEPEPPARVDVAGRAGAGAAAAVQPVWLAVRIPKDAAPGVYEGAATIAAAGLAETKVAVQVEVIGWTLPDAKEFRTYMGIYQSPETLAMYYNVPMWSEAHWALMEKSYRLLGELGCKILVIPLINRTQFGNPESYVPWIRQKDGSYQYDFAVHDRLVDLCLKYCNPDAVCYQVWNSFAGGYHIEVDNANKPTFVTVVDPATGQRGPVKLPTYGSDEAKKLWKPLMDAVMERLTKHGLAKKFILGIHTDNWMKECFPVSDMFKELVPGAPWHSGAHNRCGGSTGRGAGGIRYGLREYMYVPNNLPDPRQERRYGWANSVLAAISQRLVAPTQPPMMIHTMAERGLLLGDNGAGRMGLDYWNVVAQRSKTDVAGDYDAKAMEMFGNMDYNERPAEGHTLFGRFAESTAGQRNPFYLGLAWPGKDGPVHTINSMMMREGVQECEARTYLEQALAGLPKNISGGEGSLADRCRKLLDGRADFCRVVHFSHGYGITEPLRVTIGQGWQKSAEELYRLAAEVAATKLGMN